MISVTLGAFLDRLVRPTRERTWRSTRVEAVGWPVFEHREADPTPLGGRTIARLHTQHRNHEILNYGCLHGLQTTHSLPDGSYERYGHG